jgi:hypothetical protein
MASRVVVHTAIQERNLARSQFPPAFMDVSLKSLFKSIKAVAVRRKAPTIDVLIATTLPITFPNLEAEIRALTSAAARESRGPQAVQYVSRALNLASDLVGIAPVVGSPMKSAIGTLVNILDAIAVSKPPLAAILVLIAHLSETRSEQRRHFAPKDQALPPGKGCK